MRALVVLLVWGLLAGAAHGEDADAESPLAKDKTGIAWVHPFLKALAKAKAEQRILLIKPVAFGTTPDGGW